MSRGKSEGPWYAFPRFPKLFRELYKLVADSEDSLQSFDGHALGLEGSSGAKIGFVILDGVSAGHRVE